MPKVTKVTTGPSSEDQSWDAEPVWPTRKLLLSHLLTVLSSYTEHGAEHGLNTEQQALDKYLSN